MKKRLVFLSIYGALVMSLLFMVPVAAQYASPTGWSTLPFTDAADDVIQYEGQDPCTGSKVTLHGEIDILNVKAQGDDLVITFGATPPTSNNSYQCTIYIDVDEDGQAEYYIAAGVSSGDLFLKRINDSMYWSGSDWGGAMGYLTTSVAGDNLTIQDMNEPISTFASERYGVVWGYIGENPVLYGDYAPNDPNCPIPSFPWVLVLFSVLTLMGIIFLQRRGKAII